MALTLSSLADCSGSGYLQGIDNAEIIETVHARRDAFNLPAPTSELRAA